ncbi:MAG TPA: hypothetical protein VK827_00990 [Lysobacter sp.]|nr:hypothetical protein [Lysobacter sp.]
MTPSLPPGPRRRARAATAAWTGALVLLALVSGCTPEPPEKERPPEPQAAQHTQLRDAIHAPLDRARQVEVDTQKAAEAQREAIDAATGG